MQRKCIRFLKILFIIMQELSDLSIYLIFIIFYIFGIIFNFTKIHFSCFSKLNQINHKQNQIKN